MVFVLPPRPRGTPVDPLFSFALTTMRTTISAAFQTVALPSVRAVGTLFGTLGVLSAASMLGALGATNALADTPVVPTDPAYRCDVLVVGAGGAGMSAAIVAREKGASVLILEKMPRAGGNTLLATGHISATGSNYQAENDIHASSETFEHEVIEAGRGEADPKLVHHMVAHSGEALDWLMGLGADLENVREVPGTKEYRLFRPTGCETVGSEIAGVLLRRTETLNIPVLTFTRAEDLVLEGKRVSGVLAETANGNRFVVKANAVVLATGGYAGSQMLLSRFSPAAAHDLSSNSPGSTGDGLKLADRVGAAFTCLEDVLYHPTAVPLSGAILPESLRADGAILLNAEGRRFVNELAPSADVSEAIRENGNYAWLVVDRQTVRHVPVIHQLVSEGLVYPAHSEVQLATVMHANPRTVAQTLVQYREFVRKGADEDFRRPTMLSDLSDFPLYAIRVRPALHGTTGGVVIDTKARVLDRHGVPVPGLFATGEVTGGVHGASRLEDTALTDAIVFGRTAGEAAALYAAEAAKANESSAKTSARKSAAPKPALAREAAQGTMHFAALDPAKAATSAAKPSAN